MSELASKQCIPCTIGTPPLNGKELEDFHQQLDPLWKVIDEHHIEREFYFKNFRQALNFTNQIGALAEEEGHHPDIYLSWGKVKLVVYTHKIDGLSESDFVFAAKVDAMNILS
ncbi:4a-hydroxytetrahydrobiopterin dehydratase [Geosporobacter ferrireducens]|uniref:Putative pterin-4-alpha-carbinolamine dehydratase n=1 Tax=Geosporobacter ferrireducens TaxID=1424294 RepID=A0A1D8GMP0_9FIRM|nr:4a-hydroxytetrahydrobiopterin dehydratase [Geosporobacter ferrireducens]AOT72193.1 4a-hydroxytetrahydrobiopterin dehydratase [Geosporobacter ferrireducens]MTI56084.1 4a-hydroxytetrahydrobiopterin dehydratase [Geosporobacter ferrireducens]